MATTVTDVSGEIPVSEDEVSDGKVFHPVDPEQSERIKRVSVALLRKAGPGATRRQLEKLVNDDIIGLAGADKIFFEAFGLRLKGVPIEQKGRVSTWFREKLGKTSMPSMLFLGLYLLQSACTLIVKADRQQCEKDGDCVRHGAAFANYVCDKFVCVAPAGFGGASQGGVALGSGGQAGGGSGGQTGSSLGGQVDSGSGGQDGGSSGGQAGGSFGDEVGGNSGGQAGGSLGAGGQDGGQDADNPDTVSDANQNNDTLTGHDGGTPQYKLVWSDEFDVDGPPNPNNWSYENGFVRNQELQWYTNNNASVKNGVLVIEARKEQVLNPNYQAGSSDWTRSRQYAQYTSASLSSYRLQSWKFGRFEMSARIPINVGAWPAWWTLGLTGEWPANGEIDIMEYYMGNILTDVACGTGQRWVAKWNSSTRSLLSLGGGSWSSSFHTWRMDWDDQKISVYLDELLLNSVALSSMLNADGTSPFVLPQYMLFNLAIGGTQGGDPSSTVFPVRYEIDWVRVFQLQ